MSKGTRHPQGDRTIAVIGTRGIPASYGGFETSAERTATRWAELGRDVVVYCRRSHYDTHPSSYQGVRLRYTRSLNRFGLDTPVAGLFAVINLLLHERQARTVHLYNTGNGFLIPLLRLMGRRVSISVDGIEWRRQKWGPVQRFAHQLGERLSVRFADTVIADNAAVAAYYAERHGADTELIAYGADLLDVDETAARPVLTRHDLVAGRYFLFVGRFAEEKAVDKLIDAYHELDTDIPLVIVGDADPSPYRDAIWERASDRVRLLGFTYGDDYEHLLTNARMYVSASMLEGTSPSLLSAMAAGVCCLVNGIEENHNAAGDSAHFFAENEFDDLSRRWQWLLDHTDQIDLMAGRGREHVRTTYQWGDIADRFLEVFDSYWESAPATAPTRPTVTARPGSAQESTTAGL
ncbi:MAG: glycosyltransferase family 1 protein [Actinomycetia bacterium]|nr:glycosyltransferase family 1 protein [Actinomycetes bacterium]